MRPRARLRCAATVVGAGLVMAGCTVVGVPTGVPPAPPVAVDTAGPQRPERVIEPVRRFAEVRGLWVVRTTLTAPERVDTMVASAADAGFNTLLLQVRGRGDAYYDATWEPRAEALADEPGFDPLARAITQAHARGMAVHAWVNTHLVWSGEVRPTDPGHLVNAHPEWLAVPRALAADLFEVDPRDPRFTDALLKYAAEHRESVEGLFSSPSDPAVQQHVFDVWMDLADRYDLDGIHFDYIRFPSDDFDYSRRALDRFRAWVAPRVPADRMGALDEAYGSGDPFAFTDAFPDLWGDYRRGQITELVERIYRAVKARRPTLVVSAAVFPDADDAYRNRFQDWRGWLERGIVDVVVPMAYTPIDERFASEVQEAAVSAGRRDRLWAGIGAYLNGYEGTVEKIDIARREGAGGVILFSYDWAANDAPSAGGLPFLVRVGREKFGR